MEEQCRSYPTGQMLYSPWSLNFEGANELAWHAATHFHFSTGLGTLFGSRAPRLRRAPELSRPFLRPLHSILSTPPESIVCTTLCLSTSFSLTATIIHTPFDSHAPDARDSTVHLSMASLAISPSIATRADYTVCTRHSSKLHLKLTVSQPSFMRATAASQARS